MDRGAIPITQSVRLTKTLAETEWFNIANSTTMSTNQGSKAYIRLKQQRLVSLLGIVQSERERKRERLE